jgi:hypothetical protein
LKSESISLYAVTLLASLSQRNQDEDVTSVVRNEEANIGIVQHGGNADETSAAAGDNGDVLPGVLAGLPLAVHLVVQMGHSLAQGFDAGGRAVLAAVRADVDVGGAGKAALDVVLDLCMSDWKSDTRL